MEAYISTFNIWAPTNITDPAYIHDQASIKRFTVTKEICLS